jgi:zinc/manganese transport system substrate-binding protein
LAVGALVVIGPGSAPAQLRVVTATPTQADLVLKVGGEHVRVESLMRGPENPHNVTPKPSFVMKLRRSDLFVHTGLDAEPWVPVLLKSARKAHLLPGQRGNVDLSQGIALVEVPERGALSRAMGDIHVYGNTHYALDPLNGIAMARTIRDALGRADPEHAPVFESNYQSLAARLQALAEKLRDALAPHGTVPVVTYRRVWSYFLERFGLERVAEVEPKPGIAPGPRHLVECVEQMKTRGARIVIVETYSNEKNAELVAERAGGVALVLAQEVHALPGVDSYEALFERNIEVLLSAYRELGL